MEANVTMFAIPSAPVPRRSIPIVIVSAALTKTRVGVPDYKAIMQIMRRAVEHPKRKSWMI